MNGIIAIPGPVDMAPVTLNLFKADNDENVNVNNPFSDKKTDVIRLFLFLISLQK